MKACLNFFLFLAVGFLLSGCSTPDRYISDIRLGMTYDEVTEVMGKPFAVRAAKMFEGEEWTDTWEYKPPIFSLAAITEKYDRDYWVTFVNGRVVQWGVPGDFTYEASLSAGDNLPVLEYNPRKSED